MMTGTEPTPEGAVTQALQTLRDGGLAGYCWDARTGAELGGVRAHAGLGRVVDDIIHEMEHTLTVADVGKLDGLVVTAHRKPATGSQIGTVMLVQGRVRGCLVVDLGKVSMGLLLGVVVPQLERELAYLSSAAPLDVTPAEPLPEAPPVIETPPTPFTAPVSLPGEASAPVPAPEEATDQPEATSEPDPDATRRSTRPAEAPDAFGFGLEVLGSTLAGLGGAESKPRPTRDGDGSGNRPKKKGFWRG